MPRPPRLRMFAGPNGSGKSTLKEVLAPELLGATSANGENRGLEQVVQRVLRAEPKSLLIVAPAALRHIIGSRPKFPP